jgi:hypothetical protein
MLRFKTHLAGVLHPVNVEPVQNVSSVRRCEITGQMENDLARVEIIGRSLYLAYVTAAGGESLAVPGRELGSWDEMPEDIRYVWRGVARAAIRLIEVRY